ncbi:MAG: cell wall hydrolase, partial [Erythrobacter sp.]|nr:cell wall hydrolase [Erythrobacter sp.]
MRKAFDKAIGESSKLFARGRRATTRSPAALDPMRKRLGLVALAVAAPTFASLGAGPSFALTDLAALTGGAAGGKAFEVTAAPTPLMPFERADENFPGSAFYYLADPPGRAALIALPETDPLGSGGASAPGRTLDPGPAATPFLAAGANPRAEDCLAEAVFYEAASESEAGQRAVAQVVVNRVRHPAWPNSVCAVVFQGSERSTGCQFTFTCDGSRARPAAGAAWARARRIARDALAGEVYAPVGLATHYHTLWVAPRWAG